MTPTLSPADAISPWLTVLSHLDGTAEIPQEFRPSWDADHRGRSASVFLSGAHMEAHRRRRHPRRAPQSTSYTRRSLARIRRVLPSNYALKTWARSRAPAGTATGCVYANTMTWKTPTTAAAHWERDPRVVFERLFGDGGTAAERTQQAQRDHSILDSVIDKVAALQKGLDASDRSPLNNYLDDVREIERRIRRWKRGIRAATPRGIPDAPVGVPDTFDEHARLMYDLQVARVHDRNNPRFNVHAEPRCERAACTRKRYSQPVSRGRRTTAKTRRESHDIRQDQRVSRVRCWLTSSKS